MKRNKRAQMEKIKPKRTILIEKRAVKANQKISKKKEEKKEWFTKKANIKPKRTILFEKSHEGQPKISEERFTKRGKKKCPHMNIFCIWHNYYALCPYIYPCTYEYENFLSLSHDGKSSVSVELQGTILSFSTLHNFLYSETFFLPIFC